MNLESEIRDLWLKMWPSANLDEIDIFLEELFNPATLCSVYDGKRLKAVAQWDERKMTFVGHPISVGVVSLLLADPTLSAADYDTALRRALTEAHRQQYAKGVMCSLVIPRDDKQRQWLEDCGYMTTTHLLTAESQLGKNLGIDHKIVVEQAAEWGRDLWIYYTQNGGRHDFELKLSESDFYAMLQFHDLRGGDVLVARRHGKIVGLALPIREGKPLKSGKCSTKQFRVNVRYILAADERVLASLQVKALSLNPDCKQIVMTAGCPAKGFKNVKPHAMARAVSITKFLTFVAEKLPGLQLNVTINSDTDIPENNSSYRLRDGRCYTSMEQGSNLSTPGGIPAMLLAGQMVQVPTI